MPLTKFRAILRIFAGFREISNVKCAKFPAKIRRNFDENKARISSKFALITFAQYCIPNSNKSFAQYLPKINFNGSFVFEPVLSTKVELELLRTPCNKSHGLWSCPTRLLKCARHIIAKPLATLINISIERGSFPSKLKQAVIIPVFKGGDATDPSNYRPISLLSVFNRIFEKLMYNRLKQFMNKHHMFL